jgi:hypothetical protein
LGRPIAAAADAPVIMVPRGQWTQARPDLQHIALMESIHEITVHHTGFDRPWTDDRWRPTAAEIENIRVFHAGHGPHDRGWADIAYHFVVDRAGRVWQGRPLAYQGAHVESHNPHNLGIVLLGNFDLQRPSPAQTASLAAFTLFLRRLYHVPDSAVYMHRELGHTDCPGQHLVGFMDRLRDGWRAAAG